MAPHPQQWETFFATCLQKRLDPDRFSSLTELMYRRSPLEGRTICRALLKHDKKEPFLVLIDPRLLQYIEQLLLLGYIKVADVLRSSLDFFMTKGRAEEKKTASSGSLGSSLEANVLKILYGELLEGRGPKNRDEAIPVMKSLIAWLSLVQRSYDGSSDVPRPSLDLCDALGHFTASFLSQVTMANILGSNLPKGIKTSLGLFLPSFISLLSQSNAELANALEFFRKQAGLQNDTMEESLDNELLQGVDLNGLSFQDGVIDNSPIATRAGLYVYINAMLTGRPHCDNAAILGYLGVRYKTDVATLVTDLVTASFDVLANAMYRTESNESINLLRSFLINKVPTVLNLYAGMLFPPLTMEYCIGQALNHVDPAAFPSFTPMFDPLGNGNMLSEARQEFLFACALHQLIPEQSIESLLGDVPMQSLPTGGRYLKEDLVNQCTVNPGRIEELIGELENMEGNAGEIATAIVEIVNSLATSKDSMTLKNVCNTLSRKIQSLEVILLFAQPSQLLQSLCHLLDQWQDNEDQGEHHSIYDEFGSVFLLVLIILHHFNLEEHELGISDPNSFVLRYLRSGSASRDLDTLSSQEMDRLGDWIKGFFGTEGIHDELLSTCSPKDFHLLIATIFDQSLKACQRGKLGLESLKGQFEYLLQPFLLPSLVSGLGWFSHRLWESDKDASGIDILLPVLQALVKPPSISGDATAFHGAVLSITAHNLERSLVLVHRQFPSRADIDPLLQTLKHYLIPQRTDASSHSEIENWSSTPNGGILAALRHTLQSLLTWSSAASLDSTPPAYTHRQILLAVRILGAKAVLHALLDELIDQITSTPAAIDQILDIITSLICAPTSADPPSVYPVPFPEPKRQLTLRDALQSEFLDAYKLSKSDLPRAENVVRLHRRVEAQLARTTQDSANIVAAAAAVDDGMLLDLDTAAAAVVAEDGTVGDGSAVQSADVAAASKDIEDVLAGVMDAMPTEDFLQGAGAGDDFMGL